ncbi:translocon at the outer membrane of chloroplasts 64 [Tanacetum coccineum]
MLSSNLVEFLRSTSTSCVDTVGGVRQPAGHCGVLGFRPSYGAVSHLGIIPIAASLDTVGWFATDPSILRRVGQVLLQVPFAVQRNPRNVIIADDCFQLSRIPIDRLTQVVIRSTQSLFGKQVLKHEILGDYIASKVPSLKALDSQKSNGDVKFSSLRSLANIMQLLRRHEFSHNHFEWISSTKPSLDPVISAQVHERLELTEKDIENFRSVRSELRSALNALLKDDGVLVVPTVSSPPPKLGSKELLSEDYLMSELSLTGLASMSGCCQVTIPLGLHENYPVSVSLIARHGGDRFLLDTLQTMHASLQQKADEAGKSKSSNEVATKEASAESAKEKNVKAYLRRGTAREMLGYYKEAIEVGVLLKNDAQTVVLQPVFMDCQTFEGNRDAHAVDDECNGKLNDHYLCNLVADAHAVDDECNGKLNDHYLCGDTGCVSQPDWPTVIVINHYQALQITADQSGCDTQPDVPTLTCAPEAHVYILFFSVLGGWDFAKVWFPLRIFEYVWGRGDRELIMGFRKSRKPSSVPSNSLAVVVIGAIGKLRDWEAWWPSVLRGGFLAVVSGPIWDSLDGYLCRNKAPSEILRGFLSHLWWNGVSIEPLLNLTKTSSQPPPVSFHEYKQSLTVPFNYALQTGWGQGLAEERSEKDLQQIMMRMNGFDPYSDKKMNAKYERLFSKTYSYVDRISHLSEKPVQDLLKLHPAPPPRDAPKAGSGGIVFAPKLVKAAEVARSKDTTSREFSRSKTGPSLQDPASQHASGGSKAPPSKKTLLF